MADTIDWGVMEQLGYLLRDSAQATAKKLNIDPETVARLRDANTLRDVDKTDPHYPMLQRMGFAWHLLDYIAQGVDS